MAALDSSRSAVHSPNTKTNAGQTLKQTNKHIVALILEKRVCDRRVTFQFSLIPDPHYIFSI